MATCGGAEVGVAEDESVAALRTGTGVDRGTPVEGVLGGIVGTPSSSIVTRDESSVGSEAPPAGVPSAGIPSAPAVPGVGVGTASLGTGAGRAASLADGAAGVPFDLKSVHPTPAATPMKRSATTTIAATTAFDDGPAGAGRRAVTAVCGAGIVRCAGRGVIRVGRGVVGGSVAALSVIQVWSGGRAARTAVEGLIGIEAPRAAARTFLWLLGKRLREDGIDLRRKVRDEGRRRRRRLAQVLVEDGERGLAPEGSPAREELERHDAEGVLVGARVDRPADRLLGGHVGRGADDHPRHRQLGGDGRVLGETEVGEEKTPRGIDENVRRLHVAVENSAPVRVIERRGDGGERFHRLVGRHRARDLLLQASAGEERHDEVGDAPFRPEVVDREDAGVLELRGEARLADEALAELGFPGDLVANDLYGDAPVEPLVERLPDLRHSPRADLAREDVAPQLPARFDRHPGSLSPARSRAKRA